MNLSSEVGFSTGTPKALPTAIDWIGQLLTGHLGTSIAVLAIVWTAFTLLQGRMLVRDGLRVIVACFILFGAPLIAQGFMNLIRSDQQLAPLQMVAEPSPPISVPAKPPPFDPYAGASVPNGSQ